ATLNFNGSYQLSAGTLNVDITSISNYGRINFAGNVSLTSVSLSVNLDNGYVPAAGNAFAIVTYGSASGAFGSVSLLPALGYNAVYGSTLFTLNVGFPKSALRWYELGYRANGSYSIDPNGSGP